MGTLHHASSAIPGITMTWKVQVKKKIVVRATLGNINLKKQKTLAKPAMKENINPHQRPLIHAPPVQQGITRRIRANRFVKPVLTVIVVIQKRVSIAQLVVMDNIKIILHKRFVLIVQWDIIKTRKVDPYVYHACRANTATPRVQLVHCAQKVNFLTSVVEPTV